MSGVPRDVAPPRVVLRGTAGPLASFSELPCSIALFVPLTIVASAVSRALLGRTDVPLAALSGVHLTLVAAAIGVVVAVFVHRWALARSGAAEVFDDRVVVRLRGVHVTFLVDVCAFDDGSRDFVRLHRRAPAAGTALASWLPTPDEAGRAVLLEVLARAGVPRREGPAVQARPAPKAARELLRAEASSGLPELVALLGPFVAFGGARSAGLDTAHAALVGVASLAPTLAVLCVVAPDRGLVRFDEDRIHLRGASVAVAWDDVIGWRADKRTHVRLVLRDGLVRAATLLDPAVPTPTPEVRARVEALLAERGIPRL